MYQENGSFERDDVTHDALIKAQKVIRKGNLSGGDYPKRLQDVVACLYEISQEKPPLPCPTTPVGTGPVNV